VPVLVKFRRSELFEGECQMFLDADHAQVLDDFTLELRQWVKAGKYRILGHCHPDRWDSHVIVDEGGEKAALDGLYMKPQT
jgi:hypothetical protein